MSQARSHFGCNIFNNRMIVFGGNLNRNEITDFAEGYDIERDVWSKSPSLPLPLSGFGYASNN